MTDGTATHSNEHAEHCFDLACQSRWAEAWAHGLKLSPLIHPDKVEARGQVVVAEWWE